MRSGRISACRCSPTCSSITRNCVFKDCRAAGRCLAYDKAGGICPIPLDTTRAMTFVGMMWYHDALRAELSAEGG